MRPRASIWPMISFRCFVTIFVGTAVLFAGTVCAAPEEVVKHPDRKTTVNLRGDSFFTNGQITYSGRTYRGMKVEGLLFNSRMVQGIFDDANPRTRAMWNYPDGAWNPQRNTREFVAAMPPRKRDQSGAPRAAGRKCYRIA
jgi:hypothetical protein